METDRGSVQTNNSEREGAIGREREWEREIEQERERERARCVRERGQGCCWALPPAPESHVLPGPVSVIQGPASLAAVKPGGLFTTTDTPGVLFLHSAVVCFLLSPL